MKHEDIWRGIDKLAESRGLSVSGMARLSGLDPTAFNKSKRTSLEGKRRWPTTESLSKILEATHATFGDFVALMQDAPQLVSHPVPVVDSNTLSGAYLFDEDGFPMGADWQKIDYPLMNDPDSFGVFIDGEGYSPVFQDGSLIVVSPNASVRKGDRVVVKLHSGAVLIRVLSRQTAHRMEFTNVHGDGLESMMAHDVAWISRIVWAQQ